MTELNNYDLVPAHLAVQAMRDNGYKNTAHAIAELIDNAVQAGAERVELLCLEKEERKPQRIRRNIEQLAIIDDGSGMDERVLRIALQFGNGTRLNDRSGIGRFGMGLPSASISQCRRVEVWTWKGGPKEAIYSYLDIEEIQSGKMKTVPAAVRKKIPELWLEAASAVGKSGTLVVWSDLDRCMWRTANTIINRSESVIGRMYRHFLHSGRVAIRMAGFLKDDPKKPIIDKVAKVNDPIYLMAPSSTPTPFDKAGMFKHFGDKWEVIHNIKIGKKVHPVTIRYTIAKEEARNKPNAGATPYGKHAAQNVGVSIVRAQRELELEGALVNGYDPRERWWGVEVVFPPDLDELFGVTNNKQSARHFSEVARNLQSILSDGGKSVAEVKEQMEEDEDPAAPLVDIIQSIDNQLSQLRDAIKIQAKGQRHAARKRYAPSSPEAVGTEVTRQLQDKGQKGESDAGEDAPDAERKKELADELAKGGYTKEQADEVAAAALESGIKYVFQETELEGNAFFTVKQIAGEMLIKINTKHPAYENLVEVLDEGDPIEESDVEALRARVVRASRGLKLLLMAWARYEDELRPEQRADVQDIRSDWGRYAAKFLSPNG